MEIVDKEVGKRCRGKASVQVDSKRNERTGEPKQVNLGS